MLGIKKRREVEKRSREERRELQPPCLSEIIIPSEFEHPVTEIKTFFDIFMNTGKIPILNY